MELALPLVRRAPRSEPESACDVSPRPRRVRRALVRLFGWLLIVGATAFAVRVAAPQPARHAMLEWGSFGLADPAYAAFHRVTELVNHLRSAL